MGEWYWNGMTLFQIINGRLLSSGGSRIFHWGRRPIGGADLRHTCFSVKTFVKMKELVGLKIKQFGLNPITDSYILFWLCLERLLPND